MLTDHRFPQARGRPFAMRRHIFNFGTALSTLLFLAICVCPFLSRINNPLSFWMQSGYLAIYTDSVEIAHETARGQSRGFDLNPVKSVTRYSVPGFQWSEDVEQVNPQSILWYRFTIKYAWLLSAFSVLPVAFLTQRALHPLSRRNPELCACGYNLTGNISGVCPECGNKIVAK